MKSEVDTHAFTDALKKLNEEQRRAVETIEGPVMVIAGPGTGKTQILTLRIANILLRTDMRPENILALTFTDSGAKAMRERLRTYIGSLAYRVSIYTFHGFAEHLISHYPDSFSRIIGGRPATDIERLSIIESILDEANIKFLRPIGNPTYYVRPLDSIIGSLKQEGVNPGRLRDIIATQEAVWASTEKFHQKGAHKGKVRGEYTALEKVIAKNHELFYVYSRYDSLLRAENLYDFQDMILETVQALSSEEQLLLELQEKFQYVLADEHQDVNGAQNKILELLCNFHDSPNIFVVGDEKQAIYRFQGASLENFLYFTDLFPTTTHIALKTNYRSGQIILDTAQALIATEDEAIATLRTPLQAYTNDVTPVSMRSFSHQVVEDDFLVAAVKEKLAAAVPAHEIAVIVRTNREVEALTQLLRKAGVGVTASADSDVLEHPITKVVEALIAAIVSSKNEEALFSVLHGAYWGLSLADVVRITAARSYEYPLVAILSSEAKLRELQVNDVAKALQVMAVLEEARLREVSEPPHRVLEYVMEASGLLQHVMTVDPYEGVRVIRRLYDEIEAMVIRDNVATLKAVGDTLLIRRQYGLPLQAPYLATAAEAVQVMTAHKSKGLEFSVVFLPHLQDQNWGGKTRPSLFTVPLGRLRDTGLGEEDDERRLLYVAMTRAKRELCLSYSDQSIAGKPLLMSRLLSDAVLDKIIKPSTEKYEQSFAPLAALGEPKHPGIDTAFLSKILAERGLSATSLTNLIRNPWDFLYRNILRVPEVQALHMQFGTAVHSVLEKTTAHFTATKTWPTATEIKHWLELALNRLPVSESEYARLHEKGLAMLILYVEHLRATVHTNTKEEFSVRVALPLRNVSGITELPLSGKLDRLDVAEDGQILRVVDYKTGKPKTRAEIEGTTANSDGSYKRQITFYALLLSLYGDERMVTKEGVLSFVQPTAQGTIREEVFVVTEAEIEALREAIEESVRQFISGSFLTDETLIAESTYADFAHALYRKLF